MTSEAAEAKSTALRTALANVLALYGVGPIAVTQAETALAGKQEQAEQLEAAKTVVEAARVLRQAQRAYMALRGNEELGRAVGAASSVVDTALAQYDALTNEISSEIEAQLVEQGIMRIGSDLHV